MNWKGTISFVLFCSLLINTGCSNDLDILAPHKEIPLVYCILDQADSVHVFSGDFSWLNNKDKICDIVDRLVSDQKIKFFSSKSRSQVAEKIGAEPEISLGASLPPSMTAANVVSTCISNGAFDRL